MKKGRTWLHILIKIIPNPSYRDGEKDHSCYIIWGNIGGWVNLGVVGQSEPEPNSPPSKMKWCVGHGTLFSLYFCPKANHGD
jgi:hypothetical protein